MLAVVVVPFPRGTRSMSDSATDWSAALGRGGGGGEREFACLVDGETAGKVQFCKKNNILDKDISKHTYRNKIPLLYYIIVLYDIWGVFLRVLVTNYHPPTKMTHQLPNYIILHNWPSYLKHFKISIQRGIFWLVIPVQINLQWWRKYSSSITVYPYWFCWVLQEAVLIRKLAQEKIVKHSLPPSLAWENLQTPPHGCISVKKNKIRTLITHSVRLPATTACLSPSQLVCFNKDSSIILCTMRRKVGSFFINGFYPLPMSKCQSSAKDAHKPYKSGLIWLWWEGLTLGYFMNSWERWRLNQGLQALGHYQVCQWVRQRHH